MPTFSAEASARLEGPDWLRARRAESFDAFSAASLPSESEEVWRYSPIDDLHLERFSPPSDDASPANGAGRALLETLTAALGTTSGTVLVDSGRPGDFTTRTDGFAFGGAADVASAPELLGAVQQGGDALVRLNDAFLPDAVFVDVPDGTAVEAPVLVVHWAGGPAAFPRTVVRAGKGARVSVVEVFAGAGAGAGTDAAGGSERSLIVPVTELVAAAEAVVSYVSLQVLGADAWSLARLAAKGGEASTLQTFTVGLGAAYGRVRADVCAEGKDARSEILSAYLGDGTQIHDIRTLQDHAAPRTNSELLCQGAVAGRSRSVYSGLIRVHRGAVRSDARQTNHNLVLDEGAHADSVPNLDILENDVKCSHASTVGPIDEDQRYYIESRGVAPEVAEGLIVRGFFDAIIDRGPIPAVTPLLQREVHDRLETALGRLPVALSAGA